LTTLTVSELAHDDGQIYSPPRAETTEGKQHEDAGEILAGVEAV